ncbi:MAG: TRAP transporter TatT component family protein [Pseudomonadota bacterium]
MRTTSRIYKLLALIAAAGLVAGCGSFISGAASDFADNLGQAVFNQPDPGIVRDGAPSYLLLLDSLLESDPDNPQVLAAASGLYAAYGVVFADDPERARVLTRRARNYGERAICLEYKRACDWPTSDFETFEASLEKLDDDHAYAASAYAVASLAYIRANSDDWGALARLPFVESLILAVLPYIEDDAELGTFYNYLGILNSLRPPALGGEPERAKDYFERAIDLTRGRDLSVKVEYARGYARLLYEQELHDRLLEEVLAAETEAPGLTLTNTLAKRDARELLESGKDYF